MVAAALLDWEPLGLFLGGGAFGALGVLSLLVLTACAIVRHRVRSGASRVVIGAAVVAAVMLVALLVIALVEFDALLSEQTMMLRWIVPVAFVVVAVGGVVRARWLRARDPEVFRAIGTLGMEEQHHS